MAECEPDNPAFETEYQDEVVCPHCGHKHSDSYEFFSDHDEYSESTCGSCGKMMILSRNISVSYSARKGATNG